MWKAGDPRTCFLRLQHGLLFLGRDPNVFPHLVEHHLAEAKVSVRGGGPPRRPRLRPRHRPPLPVESQDGGSGVRSPSTAGMATFCADGGVDHNRSRDTRLGPGTATNPRPGQSCAEALQDKRGEEQTEKLLNSEFLEYILTQC